MGTPPRIVDGQYQPPDENHEAVRNAAARANALVAELSQLAHRYGLARGGPFASGPEHDDLARDVAKALFVAFRALVFVEGAAFGPSLSHPDREPLRRAYDCILGGRPGSTKGHQIRMAVAMAHQAIGMANRIGWDGWHEQPLETHLNFLREQTADLFGPVLKDVPSNKLAPFFNLEACQTADEKRDLLHRNGIRLAAEMIWDAGERARSSADPSQVFWFKLEPGDKTLRALHRRMLTSVNVRRRTPKTR